jgi:uncharacterized membrane protein (DUF485 family)
MDDRATLKGAYAEITKNPKFKVLTRKRRRFVILLSSLVLGAYYAFMAIVAFKPQLLATPVAEGSALTIGWPIGTALVIGGWLLTGLYIRRANTEFEALSQDLIKETGQ